MAKILLIFCVVATVLLVSWINFTGVTISIGENFRAVNNRRLQSNEAKDQNPLLDEKTVDFVKTLNHQYDRTQYSSQLMKMAEKSLPYPIEINRNVNMSTPIHPEKHAIIACALSETYTPKDALRFMGTARKTGFLGDIVVAVLPNAKPAFINKLLYYNATIFTVGVKCEGKMNDKCQLLNQKTPTKFTFPISFVRFFFYQTIAMKYSAKSVLFTTDFRDVFFQNNLFAQKQVLNLVMAQHTDTLMVFQEAVPNKILNRDPQTLGFVNRCYGPTGVRSIGHQPVSSSGVVLGHRNAVFMYVSNTKEVQKHY